MKKTIKIAAILLAFLFVSSSLSMVSFADEEEPVVENQYQMGYIEDDPEWISSLPVADYSQPQSTQNTSNDTINQNNLRDEIELPSSVDLSTSEYFPPVIGDQHQTGSCVSFATTYYQLTYEANKADGIVTTASNTFCPQWNYSMLCGGRRLRGSSFNNNYNIINTMGALRYSDYPTGFFDNYVYLTSDNTFYGYWSNNILAHRNALNKKVVPSKVLINFTNIVEENGSITCVYDDTPIKFDNNVIDSDNALFNIKSALNSGKLLTVGVAFHRLVYKYATNGDRVIACATKETNMDPGHGVTIVGYDDNIEADIDGDGTISSWEKGALLIVNSWGGSYGNSGFIWAMYDSLNKVSACDNYTIDNRVALINSINYEFVNNGGAAHTYATGFFAYSIEVIDSPVYLIAKLNYDIDYKYNYLHSLCRYREVAYYPHYASYNVCSIPDNTCDPTIVDVGYSTSYTGSLLFDYYKVVPDYSAVYNNCLIGFYFATPIEDENEIPYYNGSASFEITDNLGNVISSANLDNMMTISETDYRFTLDISLDLGDLDYDRDLTWDDYYILRDYIIGVSDLSNVQKFLADMNGDGKVQMKDLNLLRAILNEQYQTDFVDDIFVDDIFDSVIID